MNERSLETLACPYCGESFALDSHVLDGDTLTNGILRCPCGRYPVLAGIPVLKKDLPDQLFGYADAGDWRSATTIMLAAEQPQTPMMLLGRAIAGLPGVSPFGWQMVRAAKRRQMRSLQRRVQTTAAGVSLSDVLRKLIPDQNFCVYLLCKFAQPRHLAALSLIQLLHEPSRPVLDLGCGLGHLTRSLVQRAGSQPVVGLDQSFSLLYCAARFMETGAELVCSNADHGLPFDDSSFSYIYSFDAFHSVRAKKRCVEEMRRIAGPGAVWYIASVRSSLVQHLFRDEFISPQMLRTFAGDLPHRIVLDTSIVSRYLEKRGPALAQSASEDALQAAELVTLVASRDTGIFRDYGEFTEWPHAVGRLGINPLFREESVGKDSILLRRVFPSTFYERENEACKEYLPESVELSRGAYRELREAGNVATVEERRRLVENFVAVGMPRRYDVASV